MIAVRRADGQGASIPIGEVCLHGVVHRFGRAAAAVQVAFGGRYDPLTDDDRD
jgi:hypothetical protein